MVWFGFRFRLQGMDGRVKIDDLPVAFEESRVVDLVVHGLVHLLYSLGRLSKEGELKGVVLASRTVL
jgi:hypothetical protein